MKSKHNKEWKEFRDSGLLFLINSILFIFGWCINLQIDHDTHEILDVWPMKIKTKSSQKRMAHNAFAFKQLEKFLKALQKPVVKG